MHPILNLIYSARNQLDSERVAIGNCFDLENRAVLVGLYSDNSSFTMDMKELTKKNTGCFSQQQVQAHMTTWLPAGYSDNIRISYALSGADEQVNIYLEQGKITDIYDTIRSPHYRSLDHTVKDKALLDVAEKGLRTLGASYNIDRQKGIIKATGKTGNATQSRLSSLYKETVNKPNIEFELSVFDRKSIWIDASAKEELDWGKSYWMKRLEVTLKGETQGDGFADDVERYINLMFNFKPTFKESWQCNISLPTLFYELTLNPLLTPKALK